MNKVFNLDVILYDNNEVIVKWPRIYLPNSFKIYDRTNKYFMIYYSPLIKGDLRGFIEKNHLNSRKNICRVVMYLKYKQRKFPSKSTIIDDIVLKRKFSSVMTDLKDIDITGNELNRFKLSMSDISRNESIDDLWYLSQLIV